MKGTEWVLVYQLLVQLDAPEQKKLQARAGGCGEDLAAQFYAVFRERRAPVQFVYVCWWCWFLTH